MSHGIKLSNAQVDSAAGESDTLQVLCTAVTECVRVCGGVTYLYYVLCVYSVL